MVIGAAFAASGKTSWEQVVATANFLEQSSERAKPGEDEQYAKGTQALNEGRLSEAATLFDNVAKMRGRKAEGAVYWKAYAQNKQGLRNEALATIAELQRTYPQSRWVKEADVLELEIKTAQGQTPNPDNQADEEMKVIALNALMQSDEERA